MTARVAYFDCFSGASGDMILGALLDSGLALKDLKTELQKLDLSHFDLHAQKVLKGGIAGTSVEVIVDAGHHKQSSRRLPDIEKLICESRLADRVKIECMKIFQRLAQAEAWVHNTDVEEIHFHEVGAIDAIIDVVGAVAGLARIGVDSVYCSPFHVGSGMIECAHGLLPVPAPATSELIKGKPIYSSGVVGELLTPTGAAILTTLAKEFGEMPLMDLESVGYGAGSMDLPIPNLLRIFIGKSKPGKGREIDEVAVIDANIDDMNPQIYDYLMEKMFRLGALDVVLKPIQMKKNRPGVQISIMCSPKMMDSLSEALLREATTIGVRRRIENRLKAKRSIETVETEYGSVRCKIASIGDDVINASPEYEDCKRLAFAKNVPIKEVMQKAFAAVLDRLK